MQSSAPDVDTYLDQVPAERRPVLEVIRAACLEHLVGFDEVMRYGMPGYVRAEDGVGEVGWASQVQYISFYVLRTDVLERHRDRLAGLNVGKSCIRYRNPSQVDMSVVESMLREIAGSRGPVC